MGSIETSSQFNKLFVVQSLHDTELQTGQRLVEGTLEPKLKGLGLGLTYVKVSNRAEFFAAMDDIWRQCAESNPRIYPILHLDAHGKADRTGIAMLPSGEKVTWDELAEKCRSINVECHNNLIVASGLCHGLLSITSVNMRDSAPFLAVVGPEETVTAGEIDVGFPSFYRELLQSGELATAMSHLSSKFGLFLADRLFLRAFSAYLRENCKGEGRDARIERLLADFLQSTAAHKIDEHTARRIIEDFTQPNPASFDRFKRRFLMSDHPLNANRFAITFEMALEAADRSE